MNTIRQHHASPGGFRDPWAGEPVPDVSGTGAAENGRNAGGILRWQIERLRNGVPPDPPASAFPVVRSDVIHPHAPPRELRVTWVGHSTLLLQLGGLNVLTDPIWSRRASPVHWAGPRRLVEPGVEFDRLPELHGVILSHDHYDHLDAPTVRRIARRWPDATWITPLGYRGWLRRRGVCLVAECDWWEDAVLGAPSGALRLQALPARHWTARSPFVSGTRLWAAWMLETAAGRRFYFGGDSGYYPELAEVGRRAGPFHGAALPIGAYSPRWFMQPMHMNPEEAVRAYRDLRVRGPFVPIHWGTFRLADEPPLEPPERLRAAWIEAALPPDHLWILRHGESRAAVLPTPYEGAIGA